MVVAPSARATARSTSTSPRSWPRRRCLVGAMAADKPSVKPSSSARSQSNRAPAWATTPLPPVVTVTGSTALSFILEVPFWSGYCGFATNSFHSKRAFPRQFALRYDLLVKGPG